MLARVIAPIASVEVVFLAMVAFWWRHPESRPAGHGRPARAGFGRYLVITTGGGYLVFLAIVMVFHVWIAGQRGAIRSAVIGGAFLAAVVTGLFASLAWIGSIRRARAGGSRAAPGT